MNDKRKWTVWVWDLDREDGAVLEYVYGTERDVYSACMGLLGTLVYEVVAYTDYLQTMEPVFVSQP